MDIIYILYTQITDLISLYEIIKKANHKLFLTYNVQMTNSLTISGIALELYLKDYYNKNIPLITNKTVYNDIKLGYYGGITEVYKPYGENLYYYDVNSLYPYVALNDMVGSKCQRLEYFSKENIDLSNLFGFFYCTVKAPLDNYLGLLPVREKSRGLISPVGNWQGWYFSEEIKFAIENGYEINIVKGYNFDRVKGVFDNYVRDIYKQKSNAKTSTDKTLAKSLLNNLLGRFGLDINKPTTEIVDYDKYQEISTTRTIKSEKYITSDTLLISYINEINKEVCENFNIDVVKAVDKYQSNSGKDTVYDNVSIAISAAITAYARIHITKIKLDIIKLGGSLYYSDTDSIVTDINLPKHMVDSKAIGLLKLEYNIDKAYFISNKTYCLRLKDGSTVIKAKGVDSSKLTYENFIQMYNNNNVVASKLSSEKSYEFGYVTLVNKQVILNPNCYQKRIKVFNKGLWQDTKPIILGDSNKHTYINKKDEILTNTNLDNRKISFNKWEYFIAIMFITFSGVFMFTAITMWDVLFLGGCYPEPVSPPLKLNEEITVDIDGQHSFKSKLLDINQTNKNTLKSREAIPNIDLFSLKEKIEHLFTLKKSQQITPDNTNYLQPFGENPVSNSSSMETIKASKYNNVNSSVNFDSPESSVSEQTSSQDDLESNLSMTSTYTDMTGLSDEDRNSFNYLNLEQRKLRKHEKLVT